MELDKSIPESLNLEDDDDISDMVLADQLSKITRSVKLLEKYSDMLSEFNDDVEEDDETYDGLGQDD
jgi:hypothetical protein